MQFSKRTKIVATIGPACEDVDVLKQMVSAGLNFARLNFSHGTHENHAVLIDHIRKVANETGEPLGILQDLQGPKMRLGILPTDGLEIKNSAIVNFNTGIAEVVNEDIPITYPGLEKFLKIGERILIDDGKVGVKIKEIKNNVITTEVIEGGKLTSHKGLNFPDSFFTELPALSEKDKTDLRFGVSMGVDAVALSFVKKAADVVEVKELSLQYAKELALTTFEPVFVIAKIERPEAVANIDAILEVADGIMVARGDLGLEIPAGEVPMVQKSIIAKANKLGKPVIVATQMLDSMQHASRPTRAEVSDVANAVIDHADALMLSNETAMGEHPVVVIQTMHDIIVSSEKSSFDDVVPRINFQDTMPENEAIAQISTILGEEVRAAAIVASSLTGATGRLLSRYRPELPIFVATNSERVCHQLNLTWGVRPFIVPTCSSPEELEKNIMQEIRQKMALVGKIIFVSGDTVGFSGAVSKVEIKSDAAV